MKVGISNFPAYSISIVRRLRFHFDEKQQGFWLSEKRRFIPAGNEPNGHACIGHKGSKLTWRTPRGSNTPQLAAGLLTSRTINNLKHNRGITVYTLERLCAVLNCTPNDILEFIPD
ncbi:MAG: helix-turn-helix transcriptional regulator [Lachnospiraceae bacterium]|nr:helix-turn-helix transcriptional regulator [Butyrivibrio sp.]MCM1344995.1 helix-turn-helix transcriptional regulator [Muribaculaceae bacterium]MCM1412154.1 helix-turn-helix transcriptional regulator [Lachnospiraceae bacterium]